MQSPYIKRRGDGPVRSPDAPESTKGVAVVYDDGSHVLRDFRASVRYALGRDLKDDLARMKYEAYRDADKALIMAEELPIEQLGAFQYMCRTHAIDTTAVDLAVDLRFQEYVDR